MKKQFLFCFIYLLVVSGCTKQEAKLLSPENVELAASKSELMIVVNDILDINASSENATEVQKVEYLGTKAKLLAVVTYLTDKGNIATMGIQKTFDEAGNLKAQMGFSCKGECRCHLEGMHYPNHPEDDYLECSCSPCSMTVTVYDKATGNKSNGGIDIQTLANRSYIETFNKFENVEVTDLRYEEYKQASLQIFTYKNSKGTSSTFMLLMPKESFKSNGQSFAANKTYEIDCTGSCDCRERFMPATNGIECTCSPCKMKVTEIEAN